MNLLSQLIHGSAFPALNGRRKSFDLRLGFESAQAGFFNLEHFLGTPPDVNKSGDASWLEGSTVGGVANAAEAFAFTGAYGCASCKIPVNLGGGNDSARLALQERVVLANDLVGELAYIVRIQIDVLPGVADDSQVILGIVDIEANYAEPSDGWYFYLDDTVGGNWILKSARASARTTADSGFAPVAGAWQTLALIANEPSGCVDMFAANDGDALVQVGRMLVPVNLQPAVNVTAAFGISSAAGIRANAQEMQVDYAGFGANYGGFR